MTDEYDVPETHPQLETSGVEYEAQSDQATPAEIYQNLELAVADPEISVVEKVFHLHRAVCDDISWMWAERVKGSTNRVTVVEQTTTDTYRGQWSDLRPFYLLHCMQTGTDFTMVANEMEARFVEHSNLSYTYR